MLLARIDLLEGKSAEYRRTIADVVYDKMIECLGVPEDRFQTITDTRRRTSLRRRLPRSLPVRKLHLHSANLPRRARARAHGRVLQAVVDQLHEKLRYGRRTFSPIS